MDHAVLKGWDCSLPGLSMQIFFCKAQSPMADSFFVDMEDRAAVISDKK